MFIKLLLILLISSNTWGQSRYIDYQSPFHPTINNRGMVVSQNIESSKIGDEIIGYTKILKKTNTLVFLFCELKCNNKIITSASGVWKILKIKPT